MNISYLRKKALEFLEGIGISLLLNYLSSPPEKQLYSRGSFDFYDKLIDTNRIIYPGETRTYQVSFQSKCYMGLVMPEDVRCRGTDLTYSVDEGDIPLLGYKTTPRVNTTGGNNIASYAEHVFTGMEAGNHTFSLKNEGENEVFIRELWVRLLLHPSPPGIQMPS